MKGRKKSILIAPTHYLFDINSQSEFYDASKLVFDLARKNPDSSFYSVCGKNNLTEIPKNLYIIELFPGNSLTISIWTRILFYIKLTMVSFQVLRKNDIDVIWHLLPNGLYSFNPIIFFQIDRLLNKKIKRVIGRLQAHSVGPLLIKESDGQLHISRNTYLDRFVLIILEHILKPFTHYYIALFDRLIFVNKNALEFYSAYLHSPPDEANSMIIPQGFDHTEFPFVEKKYIPPFRLLYVGVLSEQKGVHRVLNICHELNKLDYCFTLNIVGDGDEYYKNELHRLVDLYHLNKKVNFMGKIRKSDINTYYQNSHICFLLSEKESFPNVLIESWGTGTLFVSSDIQAFQESINDNSVLPMHISISKTDEQGECLRLAIRLAELSDNDFHAITKKGVETSLRYHWDSIVSAHEQNLYCN